MRGPVLSGGYDHGGGGAGDTAQASSAGEGVGAAGFVRVIEQQRLSGIVCAGDAAGVAGFGDAGCGDQSGVHQFTDDGVFGQAAKAGDGGCACIVYGRGCAGGLAFAAEQCGYAGGFVDPAGEHGILFGRSVLFFAGGLGGNASDDDQWLAGLDGWGIFVAAGGAVL